MFAASVWHWVHVFDPLTCNPPEKVAVGVESRLINVAVIWAWASAAEHRLRSPLSVKAPNWFKVLNRASTSGSLPKSSVLWLKMIDLPSTSFLMASDMVMPLSGFPSTSKDKSSLQILVTARLDTSVAPLIRSNGVISVLAGAVPKKRSAMKKEMVSPSQK